ncbi:MAG: winged helix DNA-binding domain-containing protein, partial [Vicinamibacterales bacterium]
AVQAQVFHAAKWALALRMRDATSTSIEEAYDRGEILRTHVMRPTWHFVTPADIRWLLELTAPRVHRVMSSYNRRLELDDRTLARGTDVIERALSNHRYLTRTELGDRLQRFGLAMAGQRLAHLVMHAELEGVTCSGPRRGRQFTYALLAERAPNARRLSRDEALATLSRRFFRSHGPATIRDFVWWSGLTTADAKRALDVIKARREEIGGRHYWTFGSAPRGATRDRLVHLLPIYDEFVVAYRDRDPVPQGSSVIVSESRGPVNFQHALVIAGQVAGTWRTTRRGRGVLIHAVPLRRLSGRERNALAESVHRYQQFLAAPAELSVG